MKKIIPFAIADLNDDEINEVVDTLRSGFLSCGPKAQFFEDNFKIFVGSSYAIAVNSATSGLHLALLVLGVGPGDQVVVPVNTFTSTANVVTYLGATPVFCDVDQETFNMDPACLEEILFKDKAHLIKVVIPVHIAGQAVDLDSLIKLKKQFGFTILEDAAHALPATYNNKMIGSIGDITVFSFYPTKTLASCEGGMICTENSQWAHELKNLKNCGIDRDQQVSVGQYDVEALGHKYAMNDVAASIAIHQLKKASIFLKKREQVAQYYDDHLRSIESIQIPFVRNRADIHSRHLYIIKVENRDAVARRLEEQGIITSVHFKPLHLHSYWKKRFHFQELDFPNAFELYQKTLSLPIHTLLSDVDVEIIVQALKKLT